MQKINFTGAFPPIDEICIRVRIFTAKLYGFAYQNLPIIYIRNCVRRGVGMTLLHGSRPMVRPRECHWLFYGWRGKDDTTVSSWYLWMYVDTRVRSTTLCGLSDVMGVPHGVLLTCVLSSVT